MLSVGYCERTCADRAVGLRVSALEEALECRWADLGVEGVGSDAEVEVDGVRAGRGNDGASRSGFGGLYPAGTGER